MRDFGLTLLSRVMCNFILMTFNRKNIDRFIEAEPMPSMLRLVIVPLLQVYMMQTPARQSWEICYGRKGSSMHERYCIIDQCFDQLEAHSDDTCDQTYVLTDSLKGLVQAVYLLLMHEPPFKQSLVLTWKTSCLIYLCS